MDNNRTIHSRHVFQTYMTNNVLRSYIYSHRSLNHALIPTLSQLKFRASDRPKARVTLVSEAYNITLLMKIQHTLLELRKVTKPAIYQMII